MIIVTINSGQEKQGRQHKNLNQLKLSENRMLLGVGSESEYFAVR